MGSRLSAVGLLLCAGCFAADTNGNGDLNRTFTQTVQPFVTKFCVGCHSGTSPAAQFDLKQYTTVAAVVHDYPRWNLVLEKLAAREMPPKPVPAPPAEARQAVIGWIQAVRVEEARRNAGDPGIVLARRLSNSEYNNSIRDLTGVDMKPTREFPVDPANTAGFDNSGESLTMSPALLNKYLQAAREVADHMVLTPDGFDFAPHPMLVETDRDRYAIQRIVDFYYRQPTDYAEYFQAAWIYKHRAAFGMPKTTLAGVAEEWKLSPKYLAMVWAILEESPEAARQEVGPIAKLQAMWRALQPPRNRQIPFEVRSAVLDMRDFVVKIRAHTAMQFAAPVVAGPGGGRGGRFGGLPAGSQPLLNWKLREFNMNRRHSDPKALRNDTDPPEDPPAIPKYAGLHQEAAPRWAALMKRAQLGDPDLVVPAANRKKYEDAFERFAGVFPDVFYVSERGRYFPDDSEDKGRLLSAGYHNVMGYWRDDQPLMELILDEKGQQQLDRLWDEFDFIAHHTERTWDQYFFNQSGEVYGKGAESGSERPEDKPVNAPDVIFGLRDAYVAKARAAGNPVAVEAIKYHFQWVNDILRRMERLHAESEPLHLQALLRFAERAYRRPLTQAEHDEVLGFYRDLREKNAEDHEDAVRDSIVRILLSPKFGYRVDLLDDAGKTAAAPTARVRPLSSYALASRLSYFLWSSMPDEELRNHAAAGDLQKPEVLTAQVRRMLKDERAEGLALEFAGNWLDFRRFEDINSVDRERFPTFTNELREAMFQEPVRFIEDVIRTNRSVFDMIYGKYTFVNPVLAKHYGIPDVYGDEDRWVRIDDARQYGRGGLLPMAVFLTQNAPGLRTSPVKRGHWVVQRVLGEVIPPPPANVPELPQDEAKLDLPLRDVLAKHRSVAQCAACHARFDSLGLAFENYGPIGERRTHDLAGHTVDAKAEFPGGFQGEGLQGVLDYIRQRRENDFVEGLSRKLLAFALGRSLQLSDDLLVEQMQAKLAAAGGRFSSLVETIVTSPQFLNKRREDGLVQTASNR